MTQTKSQQLRASELKCIAKTQKIPYYPVAFESGDGALLYDCEGKEYIDFLASAGSANSGHGNKEIAQAVKDQMDKLTQYTLAYFNTAAPIELSEELIKIAPGNFEKKVAYSATGSACIDAAIKFARGFTGRRKLISMYESYHGSTYGSISLSALTPNMRRKIGPLLPEIYHFHYPDKNHNYKDCLDEIQYAFDHYLPAEEVAAIFIEPIAGDAGLIVPPVEWVQGLRKICDEHGILLVSDEIQQGMGRTGEWFGIEHFGVDADMIVLGKSVGGGLPLGAVIGRSEIMESLDAPAHVFTLAGNTTVCAAALKSLEILKRMDARKYSTEIGNYIKDEFYKLKQKYNIIDEIRGLGLSIGVDIVKGDGSMEKNYDATAKICYRCIQEGLLMIFVGQSTLRIQPPLVITKEQVDRAIVIIDKVIKEYMDGKIGDEVFEETQGW